MLTLVRGLPGSGKSTYAKSFEGFHIEADMYFIKNGIYEFIPEQISKAHAWCFNLTADAMEHNIDVIVSNTFTMNKEIRIYTKFAEEIKCPFKIITLTNNYGSTHSVPPYTIKNMKKRWEDIPGEIIHG